MKILLVGINSKYVQSNLAIRLLREYALARSGAVRSGRVEVSAGEWNVNQPAGTIVRGIAEARADCVLFSTYIWNRDMVMRVADDIRALFPEIVIGVGGPEVSWTSERELARHPALDVVFEGEGEASFCEFVERLAEVDGVCDASSGASLRERLPLVAGTRTRAGHGGPREPIANLADIPFPYAGGKAGDGVAGGGAAGGPVGIAYYESSRGCPFACAYCLSANETRVRYLSLERTLSDIDWFLGNRFPLVKFVDRTFNLDPARYLAIWRHIRDRYNGVTTFHFEVSAELLDDAAFEVLDSMPAGAVQLEIGIQSTNPETLRLVGRKSDSELLARNVGRIPSGIHTHVDLIAGLPAEGLARFGESFDFAWSLRAGMLQLGFLKVLPGAPMEALARGMPGYAWSAHPPYEVLATPELSYDELSELRDVERLVDVLYNGGLARNALLFLSRASSAFALLRELAAFVRSWLPDGDLQAPRRPATQYECLADYIRADFAGAGRSAEDRKVALEWLKYDYLAQGKPGAIPGWMTRRYSREAHDAALVARGLLEAGDDGRAPSRRTVYGRTEYEEFRFDTAGPPERFLFVYPDRKGGQTATECAKLGYT